MNSRPAKFWRIRLSAATSCIRTPMKRGSPRPYVVLPGPDFAKAKRRF